MKKMLALFLAAVLAFSFAACSSGTAKEVNLEEVRTKIVDDLAISDPTLLSSTDLLDLYGIQEADVKQSACFVTMSGIFPDEALMVEAVDFAAAQRIQEKMENRLKEVKNQSQSYDAENYALAQKCTVETNGNYIALFLSAKYEDMQTIYHSYFA